MRDALVEEAAGCLGGFDATEGVASADDKGEVRGDLRRLADAFSRWRTPDDLEELAVEWFPLSGDELMRMTAGRPVPPAWYDQDAPQP